MELSESNGLPIDAVIPLKFPAYLIPHERKIVWLIHQHRTAYELWDHPQFADLARQSEGTQVRDMIHVARPGRARRGQARVRELEERAASPVGARSASDLSLLYHRSPLTEALLPREPGPLRWT